MSEQQTNTSNLSSSTSEATDSTTKQASGAKRARPRPELWAVVEFVSNPDRAPGTAERTETRVVTAENRRLLKEQLSRPEVKTIHKVIRGREVQVREARQIVFA